MGHPGTDTAQRDDPALPDGSDDRDDREHQDGRARRLGGRGTRLLQLGGALVVLRAVQAVVAVLAVTAVGVSRLVRPAPGLHVSGLAEVAPTPLTTGTALAMVVVAAGLALMLLPRRQVFAAFAGVKALALVVASALTGAFAPGSAALRVAVAALGIGVAVGLWPLARRAALRVLVAAGLPHPPGRAGDLALALKIALLVALVAVPR
ncbi:hypothetical protein [Pseudofrankia inefficax]|uniref:Multi-sensor hybrid histidine kinase n=1 Tax=Pseudofrankia inefficax (strain DSM 45817 / CECT 9037 / DDB 130130 / EuI1c) TaxID=298654 RepID=E3J5D0_PSEI1|nr:hypothetical protein [Pseudofrankia inefficax]ADP81874.1 multi-sensor hybrid histidine kinase [Pseudofrankia inefficax]